MPKMNRFFRTLVVLVVALGLLLQPTAPALALLSDWQGQSAAANATLLEQLAALRQQDLTDEQRLAALQQMGLVDGEGNFAVTESLTVAGQEMTLAEALAWLDSGELAADATVEVDGYPIPVADFRTMVEIEQQLAQIQALLQPETARAFTPEEQEQVGDLLTQIQQEGINVYDEAGNLLTTLGVGEGSAEAAADPAAAQYTASGDGLVYVKINASFPNASLATERGTYNGYEYIKLTTAAAADLGLQLTATLVDSNGNPLSQAPSGEDAVSLRVRVESGSAQLAPEPYDRSNNWVYNGYTRQYMAKNAAALPWVVNTLTSTSQNLTPGGQAELLTLVNGRATAGLEPSGGRWYGQKALVIQCYDLKNALFYDANPNSGGSSKDIVVFHDNNYGYATNSNGNNSFWSTSSYGTELVMMNDGFEIYPSRNKNSDSPGWIRLPSFADLGIIGHRFDNVYDNDPDFTYMMGMTFYQVNNADGCNKLTVNIDGSEVDIHPDTAGVNHDSESFRLEVTNNYNMIGSKNAWVTMKNATFDDSWGGLVANRYACTSAKYAYSHIMVKDDRAADAAITDVSIGNWQAGKGAYYPGQMILVTVTFSEPMHTVANPSRGAYAEGPYVMELCINDTWVRALAIDDQSQSSVISFPYYVKEIDSRSLRITGIRNAMDCTNQWLVDSSKVQNVTFLDGEASGDLGRGAILSTQLTNAADALYIGGQAALDAYAVAIASQQSSFSPLATQAVITVALDQQAAYKTVYGNDFAADDPQRVSHSYYATVNGERVALSYKIDGDGADAAIYLQGVYPLTPGLSDESYRVQLYGAQQVLNYAELETRTDRLIYARTASFSQSGIKLVQAADLALVPPATWPSGEENTIYMEATELTTFGYTYSGSATFGHTYAELAATYDPTIPSTWPDFRWSLELVAAAPGVTLAQVAQVDPVTGRISPQGLSGTVRLALTATDGGLSDSPAVIYSQPLIIRAGGVPRLLVPADAQVVTVRQGQDAVVRWAGNLTYIGQNVIEPPVATDYTLTLYELAGSTPLASFQVTDSNSCTIPGSYLTRLSQGSAPSYRVEISAVNPYNGETITTEAQILVRSLPAVLRLAVDSTYYIDNQSSLPLSWTLDRFDPANGAEFQLNIIRTVSDGQGGEQTDPVVTLDASALRSLGGQSYSGAYTLAIAPLDANQLKALYTVTLKAKNSVDNTWSYDSRVLTVYNGDAMSIQVDGQSVQSYIMDNTDLVKSNLPTDTPSIVALRDKITLRNTVSINYNDYLWNQLQDMVVWDSSNDAVATLNYKQGELYEDIETFSFEAYNPYTELVLSGLQYGQTTLTASHRLAEMSASLDLQVNRLEDKFFIFQCVPAQKTTLKYQVRRGSGLYDRTAVTNDDGYLALYVPEGIASDVQMVSYGADGTAYMGTLYQENLLSGEKDSTKLEIYPLNYFTLRQVAKVELYLKNADGTPFSGWLTIRGGAFKNGVYCPAANFQAIGNGGQPRNMLPRDGKAEDYTDDRAPHTVFVSDQGKLVIYLDHDQFWTDKRSEILSPADVMTFIFEVQFPDNGDYAPLLVNVNSSLSPEQVMQSGDNIYNINQVAAGQENTDFLVNQDVDYHLANGRLRSVLGYEGYIGPSVNYPTADLISTYMLWSRQAEGLKADYGYRLELRDQNQYIPTQQVSEPVVYPFSTIPLVYNTTSLSEPWMITGDTRRLELRLYQNKTVLQSQQLDLVYIDMRYVERLDQEGGYASALLLNLQEAASADFSALGQAGSQLGHAVLGDMMSWFSNLGGVKLPVFSMLLSPTGDPCSYRAYIWAGVGKSGFSQKQGINFEGPSVTPGLNLVPPAGDMLSMAKGTYADEQDKAYAKAKDAISNEKLTSLKPQITLNGYYDSLIEYNFEAKRWEIIVLGGGFTAAGGALYTMKYNTFVGPVPVTAYFKAAGTVGVDFKAAVRFNQVDDLSWASTVTADRVNDYLINLRAEGYVRAFGGVGFDYSLLALRVGLYGQISLDFQTLLLSRNYLAQQNQRLLDAYYADIRGEVGLEMVASFAFASASLTVAFCGIDVPLYFPLADDEDVTNPQHWKAITDYWQHAAAVSVPSSMFDSQQQLTVVHEETVAQRRDYLADYQYSWQSGSWLRSIFSDDSGTALAENIYPNATPQLSADGQLLLHISDNGSTDYAATRVMWSQAKNGGYSQPQSLDSLSGYGDSSLTVAGDSRNAAAAWVRQTSAIQLDQGQNISLDDQVLMLNSSDVYCSIYDPLTKTWLTQAVGVSAGADLAPVVAVNADSVFLAWRGVYADGSDGDLLHFNDDRIYCRFYDRASQTWSETQTLYNGSSGQVRALNGAMLADGSAAIAYTLDTSSGSHTDAYEVLYSVVQPQAGAEALVNTVRLTDDANLDENPQLTTADFPDDQQRFVLAWHSLSEEREDVRLAAFDSQGHLLSGFADSLGQLTGQSKTSVSGSFRFAKGGGAIDELSLVWADTIANDADQQAGSLEGSAYSQVNAVRFLANADGSWGLTAPLFLANLPDNTLADAFDAYTDDQGAVHALILGNEYKTIDPTDPTTYRSYEYNGTTYYVAKSEARLYSEQAAYQTAIALDAVLFDFDTLHTNTLLPVQFTVRNDGCQPLTALRVVLDGVTWDFPLAAPLAPNQSAPVTAYLNTGEVIENVDYTVQALVDGNVCATVSDTLYLLHTDVGVSGLAVVEQGEGLRTAQLTLYNNSDVPLADGQHRVLVRLWADSDYTIAIPAAFGDSAAATTEGYTIDEADDLALIDAGGYSLRFTIDAASLVEEGAELPGGGIPIYVETVLEMTESQPTPTGLFARLLGQGAAPAYGAVREYWAGNNDETLLLTPLGSATGEPVRINSSLDNSGAGTLARVELRNNSLVEAQSGNVIVHLLDEQGQVLASQQSYSGDGLLTLAPEESRSLEFRFEQNGARLEVSYSQAILEEDNAGLSALTLSGTSASLDGFTVDNLGDATLVLDLIGAQNSLLTAVPKHPASIIRVNDQIVPGGITNVRLELGGSTVISVEAPGGAINRYTVIVPDLPEPQTSGLAALSFSGLPLTLVDFQATGQRAYSASLTLPQAQTTTVSAQPYDTQASVYINGRQAENGSRELSLQPGRTYQLKVVSPGGVQTTYTLQVQKEIGPGLETFSLSGFNVSLADFQATADHTYTLSLPLSQTVISQLSVTAKDPAAIITVNAMASADGQARLVLRPGGQTVITVASTDGITSRYTVTVPELPEPQTSGLSALTFGDLALTLADFQPDGSRIYAARLSLPQAVTTTVQAIAQDPAAVILINGQAAPTGSGTLTLQPGNKYEIQVSTPGGESRYQLWVEQASLPGLAALTLSGQNISLADFQSQAANSFSLTLPLAQATTSLLNAVAQDPAAVLRLDGRLLATGSAWLSLTPGSSHQLTVSAPDGSVSSYSILIPALPEPQTSGLSALTFDHLTLTLADFRQEGSQTYGAELALPQATLTTVQAQAHDPQAAIYVNGNLAPNGSRQLTLTPGHSYEILVLAPSGSQTRYQLRVTQAAEPGLASLTLSGQWVSLADFQQQGERTYALSLELRSQVSSRLTAVANDPAAVIRINGEISKNGQAAVVLAPNSQLSVTVTDSNGVTVLYLLNVTAGAAKEPLSGRPSRPASEPQLPSLEPIIQPSLPFTDVQASDWFAEAVRYTYQAGLMNGVAEDKFAPTGQLTRAMVVTILWRLAGEPTAPAAAFNDVPMDTWYTAAVNWAADRHIVNGYGNGSFGPLDSVTREQLAAMVQRYAAAQGYAVDQQGDLSRFPDAATVSPWAEPVMSWAVAQGLLPANGNYLQANTPATRAEVAAVLQAFCQQLAD